MAAAHPLVSQTPLGLVDFLTSRLRSRNGGVIVVTHDRALLSDVAETIIDLDPTADGRPRTYGDGYEGYRSGNLQPHTGTVRRPQHVRLGILRQESSLPLDRRASSVYAEHVDKLVTARQISSSEAVGLSQLGLLRARESGKRIGELSMGQQRRLDLALVLASKPHVLLLDEPTNHLSIALVDELTDALGATQAAVILSTHDRQLPRDVEAWESLPLPPPAESEVYA
ncbi:ATP-binding cassette domain-containing protein [Microbacterium sp. P26]|nr:ATP-binding cassette domain-containing protein [Microbacterium sp. P26]MCM3501124.1 ATP-binding cassette domain-containing protein [Microbacterium sp. P26]